MPKQKTNEQFLSELAKKNKTIIPLEEYKKANEKILVECRICGNNWQATPNNLLQGRGCPKCAARITHNQQRKSNNTFINELLKVNPRIKALGEYTGSDNHIQVECLECGFKWSPRAGVLLQGSGCPKCGLAKQVKNRTKTHTTFIEVVHEKNPNIIVLGKYVNSTTKIRVKCAKCGFEWDGFPDSLLHGHGCRECMKRSISEKNRLPAGEFEARLQKKNPSIELLGEFQTASSHIQVKCKECGHIWNPIATSLLAGRGCPICAIKRRGEQNRRTHEAFIHDIKTINPQVEILSKYNGAEKTVHAKCKVCGYEWQPIAQVLLSGGGCPNCAGNLQKTHEQFVEEVKQYNPNIEVIGKYINAKTKIALKCLICGREWNALAGNIRKGQGCPSCEHAPTSYAEQFLLSAFKHWFGDKEVVSRSKEITGQELDIYLPTYRTAIEIGSWYWHKKRLTNDNQKKERCKENGIRLIIIYDSFRNEDPPFSDDFYSYEKDYGSQRGNAKLKELALILARQFNEYISQPSTEEWNTIRNEAYRNSRMRTTEDFRIKISEINSNIEVVGEYTRARDLICCHCLVCGNRWENTPYHLLKGQGCPVCSRVEGDKSRRKAVKNLDTGEVFESIRNAAENYRCSEAAIGNCCRGKTKTCKGYRWAFVL